MKLTEKQVLALACALRGGGVPEFTNLTASARSLAKRKPPLLRYVPLRQWYGLTPEGEQVARQLQSIMDARQGVVGEAPIKAAVRASAGLIRELDLPTSSR